MWLMLTCKDRRLLLLSPHRSTPVQVQDKVTHWSNQVVMSLDSYTAYITVHIACLKLPVAALMWWLRNIFEPTVNCILTVLWKYLQSFYIWATFVTFSLILDKNNPFKYKMLFLNDEVKRPGPMWFLSSVRQTSKSWLNRCVSEQVWLVNQFIRSTHGGMGLDSFVSP